MVDYKFSYRNVMAMGLVILIIFSVVAINMWSTIKYDYQNNYGMYSDNELTCLDLGVSYVIVNNESYTCSQIMNACNINVSFINNTLDINYDIVPFCNGIFWSG